MSRYKKIKPEFETPTLTLARKRARLEKIAQTVWAFLMLFCILTIAIGGKYTLLVGITALWMGGACLALGGFLFYTVQKEWTALLPQDEVAGARVGKEERETAAKGRRTLRVIESAVLAVMGAGLLALGVLYVVGWL